ncbi:VWA domain-containing protein [Pseudaeromonas sp. ZJS20]|uniref:vWA domain-containing protein n=1 Tax=Pseudaeromonas aegiceratis TaxID=3153928 RepID=UPI00390CCCF3
MNLTLQAPYWLLLLPLPWLIYRLVPAFSTRQSAIKVPFFDSLLSALDIQPTQGATVLQPARWQRFNLLLAWLLTCLALSDPLYLAPPQLREQAGRDLMVVVDLSGSMETPDFTTATGQHLSRLAAVKAVLHDFAAKRAGDRLGLILFADAAFVQSPFTADHAAWLALLDEAQVPMAGQNTHLGDAMGLAVKLLSEPDQAERRDKLAIILTDGNDTDSLVPPKEAARLAKARGVRFHLVAMGDPHTTGEQALDLNTLQAVAETTGGQLFVAMDQQALAQAYDSINALEPKVYQSERYQPKYPLFPYLMMAVLLMHLLAFSLARWQRQRRRSHAG